MEIIFKHIVLGCSLVALTGCATIVSSPVKHVNLRSDPSGAKVTINGCDRGTTPADFWLPRWGNYQVRIELPGYQPYNAKIHKELNNWVFGNILIGGAIGVIVDTATGAIFDLDSELYAPLQKSRIRPDSDFTKTAHTDGQFVVVFANKADPHWRKIGNLSPI